MGRITTIHKPVLPKEVMENLNLKKGDVVVDATLGGGGHSREILKRIGSEGKLIAIDRDAEAIRRFEKGDLKFEKDEARAGENLILVNDNFGNLKSILANLGIKKVDAILADFGLSSDQMESSGRGFSFLKDENLNMRMDRQGELTAEYIVNNYSEEKLTRILKEYGEERYVGRITKEIVKKRSEKMIKTTFELVEIIKKAVPEKYKHTKIHPATKTFQALRMEVNNDLDNIKKFLSQAIGVLKKNGRLAVISFHSGEDRIVKNFFRQNARGCVCPKDFPVCCCGHVPRLKIVTKKPIIPSLEEIRENPRARSAKLRMAEKI